ncbi:MAG: MlaD family protein, partial [Balneolaceae bacterium]
MAKISNELKIGITVVVAIIVAFIGFSIMKDIPLFRTSTTVFTKFEKVYGLIPGNAINVRGFKIGSVKRMELLPSDSTLVELSIEEEYTIPKGSVALLRSSGVLGGKFIEIVKSDSSEIVENGESIQGFFEEGMMESFADEGAKLGEDVSASIKGFDALMNNLNQTLSEENQGNISGMLSNLESSTQSLKNLIQERKSDLD